MKRKTLAMMTLALAVAAGQPAAAQNQGNWQGVSVTVVPAGSDVLVTVPFNQASVGEFEAASVTGTGLTVAGAPLDAGALGGGFYVRFVDGDAAGLWSTITGNDAGGVDLADAAVLAMASAGDRFRIYPHHTIGSVLPENARGLAFQNNTQVLLFDNDQELQDKPSSATVSYVAGLGWLGAQGADTVLAPESAFILRNNGQTELKFVARGFVPDHPVSYLLGAGVTSDTVVGSGRPVATTVGKTNFEGVDGRQILLFDNTQTGLNQSAAELLTFTLDGGWSGSEGELTPIEPAAGFILRQSGGPGGVITTTSPY